MTCTQCSGSQGPAASEAPRGPGPAPDRCPRPSHVDCSLRKPSGRCRHLSVMGEVGPPHLPGQAVKGAAGCTKGDEPLGPCVSALEPPPSSWGTCGTLRAAPPFSLSLLPCFSAAKSGPLALSGSAWGRGRVLAAPCLGPPAWEQWTPSALHRALFPALFSQGHDQVSSCPEQSPDCCSLAWQGRNQSPHLLPWD